MFFACNVALQRRSPPSIQPRAISGQLLRNCLAWPSGQLYERRSRPKLATCILASSGDNRLTLPLKTRSPSRLPDTLEKVLYFVSSAGKFSSMPTPSGSCRKIWVALARGMICSRNRLENGAFCHTTPPKTLTPWRPVLAGRRRFPPPGPRPPRSVTRPSFGLDTQRSTHSKYRGAFAKRQCRRLIASRLGTSQSVASYHSPAETR